MSDELFRAADRVAKRLGLSRSEVFRKALVAFLRRHDDRLVTQALDRVYDARADEHRLDPSLREIQGASIPPDEW